jgi:hypothetical protein
VSARIAFVVEDLESDLRSGDLAGIIADLDAASFEPIVLFLRGSERHLPEDVRSRLGGRATLRGPLERPLWSFGLMRRALLGLGGAKPAALVFAGRESILDLAPKLAGWIERPAIYLAFTAEREFPWGRRAALDAFAKIVAQTRRMTLALVDELGVPEERVATIYPAIETDTRAPRVINHAIEIDTRAAGAGERAGEAPLVGVVGRPPHASVVALERACGGAVRLAAPHATPPLVDLGAAWTREAFARVSLLVVLPDAEHESAFDAMLRGMASGLAIVAAVPPERLDNLVIDGETGRLVASGTGGGAPEPSEIARVIAELLADPELCASMGSGGRMQIASRFDPLRRRTDYDALLRVVGGIPFPPTPTRGDDAPGVPVQFRGLTRSQRKDDGAIT